MKVTEPKLEYRNTSYYAAIPLQVSIPFGFQLPAIWDEVRTWLSGRSVLPGGAPFIRYITTDMHKKLDIEVGIPVAQKLTGEGRVITGEFPAGKYAKILYTGPFENEGIVMATAALLEWGRKNNLHWNTSIRADKEIWEARIENYLTNPEEEPDSRKWQTEIIILTK
jgi:effector-binding domain-containing protein